MAIAADDTCAPLVIGGYDCDFVESPPDYLQCPVCLLPFRDPTIPSCCGHKGCASCLGQIKAAGHPCPMCQQPFTTFLDKYFQRKVLDLRVYCSKKIEGCRWVGELRHLQTHSQRDCDLVEEDCRYKCGGRYQRRFLQNHEMDECPQRPPEVFTQSLMKKMAERMDKLEAAHDRKVTELLSSMRAVEKAHQEDRTKLTAVQSNFATVEKYHRNDRAKVEAIKKAHREDQAKLAAVEKAHREDQAKLAAVEKTHHEDQVKLLAIEKAHHEGQVKLAAVEKAHREDQAKLVAVEKAHDEDQVKLLAIEKAHHEGLVKLAAVEQAHHEDQAKPSHQILELQKENVSLEDEKTRLATKMNELEVRLQQQSERIHSIESRGPSWLMDMRGTLSSPYPPCQIVMPRFSQHKRDGDSWYSRPFYSAPGGYKLCLHINANGEGSGEGTHVSVHVFLMKGENDERLKWPFEHDVTIRMLNWKRDENHVIVTTHFKNAGTEDKARVTLRQTARHGRGCFEFLPHSSLCGDAGKQYLHEDCLCLQVVKIEPPK